MASVIIFTVVTIFLNVYFSSCAELNDRKCDQAFGNPEWSYSYTFYNETQTLKAGVQKLEVDLPRKAGEMISFICIWMISSAPDPWQASFSSILSRVSITMDQPPSQDLALAISAKRHPY